NGGILSIDPVGGDRCRRPTVVGANLESVLYPVHGPGGHAAARDGTSSQGEGGDQPPRPRDGCVRRAHAHGSLLHPLFPSSSGEFRRTAANWERPAQTENRPMAGC